MTEVIYHNHGIFIEKSVSFVEEQEKGLPPEEEDQEKSECNCKASLVILTPHVGLSRVVICEKCNATYFRLTPFGRTWLLLSPSEAAEYRSNFRYSPGII